MVRGGGGKPYYPPQRTRVIIRHLPHNIKDTEELHKQLTKYVNAHANDDPKLPPYRVRLQDYLRQRGQEGSVAVQEEIKQTKPVAVPQLYSKRYATAKQSVAAQSKFKPKKLELRITALLKGKPGSAKRPPRFSYAYLDFRSEEDARDFCAIIDGKEICTEAKESTSNENDKESGKDEDDDIFVKTNCVCELVTSREKRRKPSRQNHAAGTIEEDEGFKAYLEKLEKEKSLRLPSAEVALASEAEEAGTAEAAADAVLKKSNLGKYLEAKMKETKAPQWKKKPQPRPVKKPIVDKAPAPKAEKVNSHGSKVTAGPKVVIDQEKEGDKKPAPRRKPRPKPRPKPVGNGKPPEKPQRRRNNYAKGDRREASGEGAKL